MKPIYVKIANQIKKIVPNFVPDVVVVLGSGWGDVVSLLDNTKTIKYSDLSGMPKPTVAGHAGNFILGSLKGKNVLFVQGRFHLYEGHDISTVVLPVRIAKALGAKHLVITNAAGGVNQNYNVGDIVVVNDHINYSGKNPLIGLKPTKEQPVFVDLTNAYDKQGSKTAYDICKKLEIPVHYGTYFQFSGPNYETPAEIKMVRAVGGDLVGMSTVVEVIMANYEKLPVVTLSCVTNKAAGMESAKLNHADVLKVTDTNGKNFKNILSQLIIKL